MALNYEAICEENRRRYGTDIGRIGPMLLADRYDDRTHFIFELLQNAEDALGRRGPWSGPRKVSFTLESDRLILSHFGTPFDEADVRGVCGIAESTKDQAAIGRFGIGFKSVYMFTDRPEIHSGDEDFVIDSYVQPTSGGRMERLPDETRIVLPLKVGDSGARDEIADGFRRLGPNVLLFLQHIEEISWIVEGGLSGVYLRSKPESLGGNASRITVIGQESDKQEIDQNWLVFRRDVFSLEGEAVGRVELAFALQISDSVAGVWNVVPVAKAPLVVFFPTAVETSLGFFVQGPYRTTPSRDNIPKQDPWNLNLVEQTSALLIEAMEWMRDRSILDTTAIQCLPLEREKFSEGSIFFPLFEVVRDAFLKTKMLPCSNGGYASASRTMLARTQELRDLFSPEQMSLLLGSDVTAWLTKEVTLDRTPLLRQYVMRELNIAEVTPTTVVPKLTREFLEAQPDAWIVQLYEFLSGQEAALRRHLNNLPLVRLSDGTHVLACVKEKPQAFLPSNVESGFPTVRRAVCASDEARSFLLSLGITAPDLVDDVIVNVLQKYRSGTVDFKEDQYVRDIERVRIAYETDSKAQREKLLTALRETPFVAVGRSGQAKAHLAKPGSVYIATDRIKLLFQDVPNVMIVEDTYDCLRGEKMRDLLEACGAVRCPRPVDAPRALNYEEKSELRRKAGHEWTSGINDHIEDWLLEGFDELVRLLPKLPNDKRVERARLIWESLGELEERRGRGVFEGSYRWSHYGSYRQDFPSAFVRHLNEEAWVPGTNGELKSSRFVIFDDLGWKPNPFLLSKIEFKPPIIDQLAREAGIDPAAIDLLRQLGITSVAELTARLGVAEDSSEHAKDLKSKHPSSSSSIDDVYQKAEDLYGDDMPEIPPPSIGEGEAEIYVDPSGGDRGRNESSSTDQNGANSQYIGGAHGHRSSGEDGSGVHRKPVGIGDNGCYPFVSYIATHANSTESDPDGFDQTARLMIEDEAIDRIRHLEPTLERTPNNNPGFDLFESDAQGRPVRWVEVKSMKGSLNDRPVGMSQAQFNFAREKGKAYWLYIVEYALDEERFRVLRIQDPVGHACTYTFDKGWASIAIMRAPH